jgi:3-hydroxyisobutyrate dehydrogenase-like beta-hydroxyacid dehydrogenase
MGSAFARAALASGRRVAVWNRSAARARALLVDGAQVMESAEDAVRSAPIAILCVGTSADAREVLESVAPAAFAGVTVLNVTSGGPEDSVAIGHWADARGISYLDGAILAYPKQIGTPEACILVAGRGELWESHQGLVCDLAGSSLHVGPDYGAASVIDASLVGGFYISSVVAFVEATRHMTAYGAPTSVIESLLGYASSQLEGAMRDVLQRVDGGEFGTDQATLKVYQEATQGWLASMRNRDAAPMLTAAVATLCRGVDEGMGEQDIAALVKLRTL